VLFGRGGGEGETGGLRDEETGRVVEKDILFEMFELFLKFEMFLRVPVPEPVEGEMFEGFRLILMLLVLLGKGWRIGL
jgi:hypothetical protein